MELPSKRLEQVAFNTRPELAENLLIFSDQSTNEVNLCQTLQTKKKQFIVVFLTVMTVPSALQKKQKTLFRTIDG